MAVFWYLDDIVPDWIGQTGPGLGAKVIETRGKVKTSKTDVAPQYKWYKGMGWNGWMGWMYLRVR